MKGSRIIICVMLFLSICASETSYNITVTREANDLYKVDGTNIYVETLYCYEYAYSDEAILICETYVGYPIGSLYFIESKESYDVVGIYQGISPSLGTKVLTPYGELEDVEEILVPTTLE